jgi:hypothetical protein
MYIVLSRIYTTRHFPLCVGRCGTTPSDSVRRIKDCDPNLIAWCGTTPSDKKTLFRVCKYALS